MTEKITVKQIIDALQKSNGFKSVAAENLGVTVNTINNYFNRYPELNDALKDIKEKTIDFAESKLMELIKEKDKTAIIFYLKTQAKHRGYIERVENHNLEVTTFDDLPKLNDLNVK